MEAIGPAGDDPDLAIEAHGPSVVEPGGDDAIEVFLDGSGDLGGAKRSLNGSMCGCTARGRLFPFSDWSVVAGSHPYPFIALPTPFRFSPC